MMMLVVVLVPLESLLVLVGVEDKVAVLVWAFTRPVAPLAVANLVSRALKEPEVVLACRESNRPSCVAEGFVVEMV